MRALDTCFREKWRSTLSKWLSILLTISPLLFLLSAPPGRVAGELVVDKKTVHWETLLVLGLDSSIQGTRRPDVILLCSFSPEERRLVVLSIPRDTLLPHGKVRMKANSLFAKYGFKTFAQTLQTTLGVKPGWYLAVDYRAVKDAVNAVGGLDIEAEKDMHYVDKAQHLVINIRKGEKLSTGEKVLEYVRFRMDREGDIGRIEREKRVIRALAEKLKKKPYLVPAVIHAVLPRVKTNSSGKTMKIVYELSKTRDFTTIMVTLPGNFRGAFWEPDKEFMNFLKANPRHPEALELAF